MLARAMVLIVATLVLAGQANAFEAFDGRVQAHGYFESQLRVISADFAEDWDVTQWYNIFHLELEFDIAPDGFGPFDLLSAYIGIEVRYDCIYSRGCGMFRGMNTYGDRSTSLPDRLSNANQQFATGQFLQDSVVGTTNGVYGTIYTSGDRLSGDSTDPAGLDRTAGFRGLLRIHGADQQLGNPDLQLCRPGDTNCFLDDDGRMLRPPGFDPMETLDPQARLTYGRCRDNATDCRQFAGGSLSTNGQGVNPDANWDPSDPEFGNFGTTRPTLNDGSLLGNDDPSGYLLGDLGSSFRFTQIQRAGGSGNGNPIQIMGPWLPKNFVSANATLADRINPFDNYRDPLVNRCPAGFEAGCDGYYTQRPDKIPNNTPLFATTNIVENRGIQPDFNALRVDPNDPTRLIKRDYLKNPNGRPVASPVLQAAAYNAVFRNPLFAAAKSAEGTRLGNLGQQYKIEFALAKLARSAQREVFDVEGSGSSGFRPIPINAAGDAEVANTVARGLYIPSEGLTNAISEGRVNYYPFNINETDRAWNRGASQQQTKELKEAYFDMEFFDSALWIRLGKQNIVWGKTELFRTTDQFNPQDFSLASLPTLEESRIGLWAFRGIYSLYEVGPLEDVRLELAFNFDEFQPADLGGCGEPYAVNVLCSLTFGSLAHGAVGIGVAGLDRPDNPWDDIKGWEGGVRIEFRWDMFTFAISDFYGFNDFPTLKRISTFERNVDPITGRPRAFGARGPCALPTGPDDSYYQDEDCLRPGPSYRLELRDEGVCDGRIIVGSDQVAPFIGIPCTIAETNTRPTDPGTGEITFAGRTWNRGIEGLARPDGEREVPTSVLDGAGQLYSQLIPANNVPYFLNNDAFRGDPNDIRHRYADPDDELYVGDLYRRDLGEPGVFQAPPCDATIKDDCIPALYIPQFDVANDNVLVLAAAGRSSAGLFREETQYSDNNALTATPVNLQFYNLACAATIGTVSIDPTACAVSVFSSRKLLVTGNSLVVATVLSQLLGGYSYFSIIAGQALAGTPPPLVQLWKDRLTVVSSGGLSLPGGSRERDVAELAGCFDFRARHKFGLPDGRICDLDAPIEDQRGTDPRVNFLTLNAALTAEQEAILGCGPFFGNNCDAGGVDLLWGELSAWVQSFPGVEGTLDLSGEGWRSDGLKPGSKVQVGGEPLLNVDRFDPNFGLLSDLELCRKTNGAPSGGCEPPNADGRRKIKLTQSPYFGLFTDDVRKLFTPVIANCSTWLGRTNPGVDCVERYAQPGTIGARDIGFGTFDVDGNFIPDPSHPNFTKLRGPICTTATFGGGNDQVLPGCRDKWRNYQDEFVMREGEKTQELNLFGIDKFCQERPGSRGSLPECTRKSGPGGPGTGDPLPGGQVYGGEFSPRADSRSWDATRDGDPDFLGWDSLKNIDPLNSKRVHAAVSFRTNLVPGNENRLEVSDFRRCSILEYFPTDQGIPGFFVGQGVPQCSRFQRDGRIDENTGGPVTDFNLAVVYPKGGGHPFTGSPWANELAAYSFNLLSILVSGSAAYQIHAITETGLEVNFPFTYRQPLAYATWDPRDPDNAGRIADIQDIQDDIDDGTISGAQEIRRAQDGQREIRAQMKPICSFITTKPCLSVGAILGLAGQGSPQVRAGGNGRFGRRTASFQAGGEILLTYDKRNVLGFGMDFAEDHTKSSWGVEFTWIPNVAYGDADSFSNISRVDTYNLTISVDRPTFVNFLNANRTFFVTSQWFFQYIDGYKKSFTANRGPYNVLGIFLVTTGYFQDRLLPTLLFVYDQQSVSGAASVSFTYRYSENFSVSMGVALFMGREVFTQMGVNGIGPPGNRLGDHAFEDGVEPGLSLIRDRDEAWLRLRYTF